MSLYKIKQPVEYSFLQWMNNFSAHPLDSQRFYVFVKTVCMYKAKKWEKPSYLRSRILEAKPHCDKEFLERRLDLYTHLLAFHRANACSSQLQGVDEKKDRYIEIHVKNGIISEVELPIATLYR